MTRPRVLRGRATTMVEFGQHVLVRNGDCSPAEPCVANGVARPAPSFERKQYYQAGDLLIADPIDGQGARDLHALAAGPIMDPIKLYLPAGRLTEAEYQARLDLQFAQAGLERPR